MAKVILRLLVVSSLMWLHISSPIRNVDTATETLTDAMVRLIIIFYFLLLLNIFPYIFCFAGYF